MVLTRQPVTNVMEPQEPKKLFQHCARCDNALRCVKHDMLPQRKTHSRGSCYLNEVEARHDSHTGKNSPEYTILHILQSILFTVALGLLFSFSSQCSRCCRQGSHMFSYSHLLLQTPPKSRHCFRWRLSRSMISHRRHPNGSLARVRSSLFGFSSTSFFLLCSENPFHLVTP